MTQENTTGIGEKSIQTGNQPEKKFRAGVISATVWLNHGQSKNGEITKYRTVSIQRGYKDRNDQWQNTTSMRVNDLPRAALVLNQAYNYLVTKKQEDSTSVSQSSITDLRESPITEQEVVM